MNNSVTVLNLSFPITRLAPSLVLIIFLVRKDRRRRLPTPLRRSLVPNRRSLPLSLPIKRQSFPVLLKMMLPLLNPRWITLPWKTLTIIRLHPGAYGILCRIFSHLRARSHRAWFFSPLLVGSFSTYNSYVLYYT